MHALIVGAGSVGQVYGYYLQRGGARVTYLVKPKHVPGLEDGVVLYPWNRRNRAEPVHWKAYELATDLDQAFAEDPDVVFVATSATALMSGTWFEELVAVLGDRTLVSLQPGTSTPEWIYARMDKDQVVWGLIALSAFPAPMPGQDLPEPGQGWWVPWGSKLGFSGPTERAKPVVDAMGRGGVAVALRDDIHVDQAFMGPILANTVVPLELSGWSMKRLADDAELLGLAHRCMKECWAWAEAKTGQPTPFVPRNLSPGLLRIVLRWLLPQAPLDMETFFRVHYTKIADQTPILLKKRIEDAQELGVGTEALEALYGRLMTARGDTPLVAVQPD